MKVTVNGVSLELPQGATLLDALNAKSIKPQGIATAINDVVITANARETTQLNDGDKIVIIKAFYGG